MKHISLKSNHYKLCYSLMKSNKKFSIVFENGEVKTFEPNSVIYNVNDLKFYFKFAHEMDDKIVEIKC